MLSEQQDNVPSNNPERENDPDQPMVYQIRVKSHLDSSWKDWFDGLAIKLEDDGDMLLTGLVMDQAALYGLLKKVRDLGMLLISVNRLEANPLNASDVKS